MASVAKARIGDLVLSKTKCYGVVLYYMQDIEHYIILWTIVKNDTVRFNEQLREPESFEKV